jgi:hypothetical protein
MTVVAIHQPNYLPWLGFFDKLVRSDVFIILDNAQFPKTGGNWVNRTQIRSALTSKWLSIPVRRPDGVQLISDVRMLGGTWRENHFEQFVNAYREAHFFQPCLDVLKSIYEGSSANLASFNLRAISSVLSFMGMEEHKKFTLASTLEVNATGTRRLVELVKKVGGTEYLSGDGSAKYLEVEQFEEAKIHLRYQEFQEPIRTQSGDGHFVPGLSVVDALAEIGAIATRGLLGRAT